MLDWSQPDSVFFLLWWYSSRLTRVCLAIKLKHDIWVFYHIQKYKSWACQIWSTWTETNPEVGYQFAVPLGIWLPMFLPLTQFPITLTVTIFLPSPLTSSTLILIICYTEHSVIVHSDVCVFGVCKPYLTFSCLSCRTKFSTSTIWLFTVSYQADYSVFSW